MSYIDSTERVGDLIVQVVADEGWFSGSPYKEFDQTSEVFGEHRSLDIDSPPREHIRILERIGLVGLYRYMRRFGDPRDGSKLLAMKQLDCYEHSGITVYTSEIGTRRDYHFDPGGWDTSHFGYVLIVQSRWDKMNGGDPDAIVDGEVQLPLGSIPVKQLNAYACLDAEVKTWDSWLRGDVWGYVVTKPCDHDHEDDSDEEIARCPHSEVIESCWGYIGEREYALSEGKEVAQYALDHPAVHA